ncbi:hypothetical protein K457DRAFT_125549 [Linnemannia elongata AG-77]|uniref:F-box domain-containing protein n=1 Tax=Linnemannia elongata AG-77 TaxID=1314771 RepID=A0A197JYE7_9FUNG|nr:hypothetical protein K457DRAFT_125549 [Linnemannia elongata AG-77]
MSEKLPAEGNSPADSKLFFSIPEMREAVMEKLTSMTDQLSLSLVNRMFRTTASNFIWNNVNFRDAYGDVYLSMHPNRFLESPALIQAINENRSAVKTHSTPLDFCWILFEATIGAARSAAPCCNNGLIARTLIRALFCLHCLKDFYLEEVDREFQIPLAFMTKLFDCLSTSIESLSLVYVIDNTEPAQVSELPATDDADAGLEPLGERQGPLSSLLELRLPKFDGSYSAELITRFLCQCPKLNTLVLPNPMAIGVMPSTGPNVRNVSILDPVETAPVDREAVVATLDTLNLRHVETIVW